MPKRKGEHLWGVESLSDVEVVVEGKTFPLNKFCLSLNSTFFRTKFASPEWSGTGDKGRMDLGDVPGGAVAFEIAAKFCYDKEDGLESADLMLLPEVMRLADYLGMAEGDSSLMARANECLTNRFEEAQSKVATRARVATWEYIYYPSDDDDDDEKSAAASEAICAVVEVANKILHDPRIKNAVELSDEMKKVLGPMKIAACMATALSPLVSFQPKGVVAGAVTSRVASPRDIQDTPLEGAIVVHGVRFGLIYEVVTLEGSQSDDYDEEGSPYKQYGLHLAADGSDHAKENGPWEVKASYVLRGLSPKGEVVKETMLTTCKYYCERDYCTTYDLRPCNGRSDMFTEEHLQKMVDSKGGITVQATFTILEINGKAVVAGETSYIYPLHKLQMIIDDRDP